MATTNWQKQTKDAPLFPDMLWSRPENRLHAGKLLIIGGNGYEFKSPANAYGDALHAGVGTAKVLLPDSMYKTVRDIFPEAEFAPSTPSGSFARTSLAQALDLAAWADGVLWAGDLGRNSETAIFLESFLHKHRGQVTLVGDAADHCLQPPAHCADRPDTTLVLSFAQLQKLGTASGFTTAFTTDMDLAHLVEALQRFTTDHTVHVVTVHDDIIIVAIAGKMSTTKVDDTNTLPHIAASTATWWLQNPSRPFQAHSSAVYSVVANI